MVQCVAVCCIVLQCAACRDVWHECAVGCVYNCFFPLASEGGSGFFYEIHICVYMYDVCIYAHVYMYIHAHIISYIH